MTRKATNQPPTSISGGESELRRYSPEQVIEKQLLPYKSARVLKEKCYRRELYHRLDSGRITFTAEDIRKNTELAAVVPINVTPAA